MSKHPNKQLVVRLYRSEKQFGLAAPLPGLEPGDIHITIEDRRLTIHGKQRGPHQDDLSLLKTEWSIGPYYREISLPESVDGTLANATYGNGVLVLTMPKSIAAEKPARAEFTLQAIDATRGERVGHVGHNIQRTTTREHLQRHTRVSKKAVR